MPAAVFEIPMMCNPGAKENGDKRFNAAWTGSMEMFKDDKHSSGLWKTDGTEAGTTMVRDIFHGFEASDLRQFTNLDGRLMFVNGDSELWASDGTKAGTVLIKDLSRIQSVTVVERCGVLDGE